MATHNGTADPQDDEAEGDFEFERYVTDEQYEELVEALEGDRVVGLALWEESLADDEDEEIAPADREVFDFDLYLENHAFVELYAVYLFSDPESDPLRGLDQVGTMFSDLIEGGLWLDEVAVTEDDELVLVLSRNREPQLYLNVGGWSLSEWETLPEEDE